jgi:hypothetical protein
MFDGKIVGEKENKNVTDRELGLLMAGVTEWVILLLIKLRCRGGYLM